MDGLLGLSVLSIGRTVTSDVASALDDE